MKNRSRPAPPGDTATGRARRIQSVEVGFRVVRVLADADQPLPLKEVAARAAMPASKAYVYLASFASEGLVEQDPETGHYGLGRFALQLGLAAARQADVLRIARPHLEALRAATECAAYLSVWGNRGPVVALKVDGAWQGSLAVRIGYVLPLRITATGRVFMAHLPPAEWRPVLEAEIAADLAAPPGRPPHLREAPGMPALEAEIARVRAAGHAASRHRRITGFEAMAAPVFDYSGAIAAAVTMLGPTEIIAGPSRAAAVRALTGTAARISESLGHVLPAGVADATRPGAAGERRRGPG